MKVQPSFVIMVSLFALLASSALKAQIQKGTIVEKEVCTYSSEYSYAYYLPTYYENSQNWPVIFVFEPAARGVLGVKTFKAVAEKYGYAIFCSNEARNGPTNLILDAAEAMFQDVYRKFSLDNNRTHMGGFSGGSRVSSLLALMTGKINTVIACGAGLPDRVKDPKIEFNYYGIVGNRDFNFVEMMQLEERMDSTGVNHNYAVYQGIHDWPPPLQIELAILWIELQEMKVGTANKNAVYIKRYATLLDSLQQAAEQANRPTSQLRLLETWMTSLTGLSDVSVPGKKLLKLYSESDVQRALEEQKQILEEEAAIRLEIKEAMYGIINPYMYTKQNEGWWKEKVAMIAELGIDENPAKQDLGERIKSTITANCWIQYDIALEEKVPEEAEQFVQIWLWTQPDSLGANWLMAKLLTEKGERKKAVEYLYHCRELGMKNYSRLQSDTTFSKLIGYKKFDALIVEMDTLR